MELKEKQDRGAYLLMTGLVTREGQPPSPLFTEANRNGREQLPMLSLHPKENWNGQVVVWVRETAARPACSAPTATRRPR